MILIYPTYLTYTKLSCDLLGDLSRASDLLRLPADIFLSTPNWRLSTCNFLFNHIKDLLLPYPVVSLSFLGPVHSKTSQNNLARMDPSGTQDWRSRVQNKPTRRKRHLNHTMAGFDQISQRLLQLSLSLATEPELETQAVPVLPESAAPPPGREPHISSWGARSLLGILVQYIWKTSHLRPFLVS